LKRASICAALTAALVIGFAANASAANPPNGVFQGILNASTGPTACGTRHNEGEGYFRVVTSSTGKRIVPVGNSSYCGGLAVSKIVAPSGFHCNQFNANLVASRIALSNGAFDYSGNAPIGPNGANRHVHFKGHWDSSASRFVGFTQITSSAGCNSGKDYWRMKRVSTS
jgi:hypothetical protein